MFLAELRDIFSTMTVEYGVELVAITDVEVVDVSVFLAFTPALHAAGSVGHFVILVVESVFICCW